MVFVESAVPGDVVDIRITKKKPNYMEGFVVKMKKPSEYRLKPFCEHFGLCGGCKWQPLPYPMQLQAKQQQVWDQLVRLGHLDIPEISPIIGSRFASFLTMICVSGSLAASWFPNISCRVNSPAFAGSGG